MPSALGLCTALRELVLVDNVLRALPTALGTLWALETLALDGNPLNDSVLALAHTGAQPVIRWLRDQHDAPPPHDRPWISLASKESITVMCYNTLCDKYATPQAYPYTPSWALAWDWRKDVLLQDILNYNADIVCLQVKSIVRIG